MSGTLALNLIIDAKTGKLITGLNKGKNAVAGFEQKVSKTSHTTQKATNTVGGFAQSMGGLKAAIGGVALGYFVKQVFQGIDAMQGMEAQLKTITGNVEDAGLELDRLIGFAKKTPFTIEQSVTAFSRLVNMGLNPSEKAMLSYGNTAAAMGKDMMQMVEAVADAATGEFERLKEFGIKAKNNGDTIAFTFQGQTKSVLNNAAAIEDYLQALGENEFAGAMTDQMDKLSAKTSNLGIGLNVLMKTVGDAGLTAVFGSVIDTTAELVNGFNELLSSGEALDELTIWAEQFGEVFALVLEDLSLSETVEDIGQFGEAYISQWGKIFSWFGDRFDYLLEVLRDFPAHYRTIYAIIIGEVQILFEKIKSGTMLFFSFLDEGFENMSHGISAAWGWVELQFAQMMDGILGHMADSLNLIAESIENLPYMEGIADSVKNAALALDDLATSTANVEAANLAANKAHEDKIAIINKVRVLSKADAATSIKEIDARILKIIKERDALIKKSNLKRKAASDARKQAKQDKKEKQDKLKADRANKVQVDDTAHSMGDLTEQIDKVGESWNNSGNLMTKAFGSVADNIDKMSAAFTDFGVVQDSIDKKRAEISAKYKKDSVEYSDQMHVLSREENRLGEKKVKAALGGFGAIAGAASQMFDEHSKGREALHKIEQAFTVIEVALAMQKAAANALVAITAQGSGDPYTAFARIAAMAAIMAGLGVFTGSVSGASVSSEDRQKAQGVGTVFGSDEKSASIVNATERMFDLELDQYAELISMNSALRDLNNNITHLAISLVGSFGRFDGGNFDGFLGAKSTTSKLEAFLIDPTGMLSGVINSFSKKKVTLQDSGIEIGSQTIGDILSNGRVDASQYFDTKTKKSSWWGLSSSTKYKRENQAIGDDIERELGLVFTSISETINDSLDVLGIDVTNELAGFLIDLPQISLKGLSGDEIQAELEAVFSQQADLMAAYVLPGIKEFQTVGEGLYETLVRVAQEQVVFNNILELTGQSLGALDAAGQVGAAQSVIELAGSITELSDAANDYFMNFYSEAEQFTYLQDQLTDAFGALNVVIPDSREGFRELIESFDLTTQEGQSLYAALLQLSPRMDDYYDQLADQADIAIALVEEENRLAQARKASIENLSDDIKQLVDDILPTDDLDDLIRKEQDRLNNQQQAAEDLYDIEMQRYEDALDANKSLDEFINGLAFSDKSTLTDNQKQRLAKSQFDEAVKNALEGDASSVDEALKSASKYLGLSQDNVNGHQYSRIFNEVNTTLSQLQDFYANYEAPELEEVDASPELIKLQDELDALKAEQKQQENEALAALLGEKIGDLAEISDQNIESVIESLGLDIAALGDALNVNLLELINVTRENGEGGEILINGGNIVALPTQNLAPQVDMILSEQQKQAEQGASEALRQNRLSNELTSINHKLETLTEVIIAIGETATGQRAAQINTAKSQLNEVINENLRKVGVS